MNDSELLRAYLSSRSEAAFAELVERYINLVYSAARRQVRDSHLAEDITQAVFIALARKAGAIRNPAMLGAWLLKTARQTSCNAIRFEQCRRRHEQEAAIMKNARAETGIETVDANMEGVLDEYLSRLGERDRGALVLRYMQEKSVNDVALALRISLPAAEKRVARALSRLKNLLSRRGIFTAEAVLEKGLGSQVLYTAPAGLAQLASGSAMGKIKMGGGLLLAHSTARAIFWAKVKALAVGFAASGAVAAMVAAVTIHSMADTRASAADVGNVSAPTTIPTTAPDSGEFHAVHLANDAFQARGPADLFLNELDPNTLRTPTSSPAGHIKSLIQNIPRDGQYTDYAKIRAMRVFASPVNKIRGTRVRISGWIKTKDVRECAGVMALAYGDGGELLAVDDMAGARPIHGTTEWQNYQIVRDIPKEATKLVILEELFCSGEIWTDDFQVEVVGNDVPQTENDSWNIFSPVAERYSVAVDPVEQHNGHATMCMQAAKNGAWAIYMHTEMHPDPKFVGHRIRISAWVKSRGLTGQCGFQIRANGPWDAKVADEGQRGHRPIVGTRDWQLYTAVSDVPAATKSIDWGMTMNGRGKLWIDLESVQVELADDAAKPADEPGN